MSASLLRTLPVRVTSLVLRGACRACLLAACLPATLRHSTRSPMIVTPRLPAWLPSAEN
jgi:hypothetical protein